MFNRKIAKSQLQVAMVLFRKMSGGENCEGNRVQKFSHK